MAALTTAAIVGAAALGGAATIAGVKQQSKLAKQQARALKQQEAEAKAIMQNEAELDGTKKDTGAQVLLGRGDEDTPDAEVIPTVGSAGQYRKRVGGFSMAPSVSRKVGI